MAAQTAFVACDVLHAYLSAPTGAILEVLPYVYFGIHCISAGESLGAVLRKAGCPTTKRDVRGRNGDVLGMDFIYPTSARQSVVVRISNEMVTFVAKRAEP